MKRERDVWFYKAVAFLKAKKFPCNNFNIKGGRLFSYCNVKSIEAGESGFPKRFGVIFENELTTVYVRDGLRDGGSVRAVQKYPSIEALLEEWDID